MSKLPFEKGGYRPETSGPLDPPTGRPALRQIDRRAAQNAIKALSFVDRREVPLFVADGNEWQRFRSNPADYFARAPDDLADIIWRAASGGGTK